MQPMHDWFEWLKALLTQPEYGLTGLFLASFLSATLLPLGSEVLLVALLAAAPQLWAQALLVSTAGNTLGGVVTWWMGRGAERAWRQLAHAPPHEASLRWLRRFGPKACVFSWLPVVGDPLCAVAGWLRLPFWECAAWILLGKFGRFAVLTAFVMGV